MRRVFRLLGPVLVAFVLPVVVDQPWTRAEDLAQSRHWRQPIALAKLEQQLYVANRVSGTVSIIDPTRRQVLQEVKIGQRLSDLKPIPGSQFLLALDEAQHELILLLRSRNELQVVQRLRVPSFPVTIEVAPDGSQCSVASLWSRRVSVIDLTPLRQTAGASFGRLAITHVLDLPFAPRVQKRLRETGRLVVADAFSGRMAVLDTERGQVLARRQLLGHNIRGLSEDRRRNALLVTHQRLRPTASTSSDQVQWGAVISNLVRAVPIREFLSSADGDQVVRGIPFPLGSSEDAAGDPHEIQVTPEGRLLVSLAGVGQVGIGTDPGKSLTRVNVGQRPTAMAIAGDERVAYIANTLDDSISVIDLIDVANTGEISLGPHPDLGLEELGERHFYDARVSLNGWFSCHSCHTDGHSNGQLNDNLGDGTFGAQKRVLSLLGVADTGPWAWNATARSLPDQIRNSMRTTMRSSHSAEDLGSRAQALEKYLHTLPPAPALDRARDIMDSAAVDRGQEVFARRQCVTCHRPPTYTSEGVYDVGLRDSVGNQSFNPPSLRGVSQRDAFFHDNRAVQLAEVFERFRHGLTSEIASHELDDLLAFLRSL